MILLQPGCHENIDAAGHTLLWLESERGNALQQPSVSLAAASSDSNSCFARGRRFWHGNEIISFAQR